MKIPKPILERRRSIRLEEALPFKIGSKGYEQEAATLNISSHGVMVWTERDIPMMARLSMALALPSGPVEVMGVVVRKEKDESSGRFRVAIFFSEISAAGRQTLKQYFKSRLRK